MRVPSVPAGIKILWSNTKILTLKFIMAASKTIVGTASVDGAEDMPKNRCVFHVIFLAGIKILCSITYTLTLKWSM